MKHEMPKTKAVFLHGSDIEAGNGSQAVFEEKRSSTVIGVAYPADKSRNTTSCKRALDIAIDCFMDRPSDSDEAMWMIGRFMDDGVCELHEGGEEVSCSPAMLYIYKGKARVYPKGYSAVLFFEGEGLANIWYGDGIPAGSGDHTQMSLPETLKLGNDCRFVFIAGEDMETVKAAAEYAKETKGEDTEGMKAYMSDKHIAWINVFLPERKREFIGLRGHL